jgi:hypothetical protein
MSDPECAVFEKWITDDLHLTGERSVPDRSSPGEELQYIVHFINAWDLHMNGGEVHCGTNALRKPMPKRTWLHAWRN